MYLVIHYGYIDNNVIAMYGGSLVDALLANGRAKQAPFPALLIHICGREIESFQMVRYLPVCRCFGIAATGTMRNGLVGG